MNVSVPGSLTSADTVISVPFGLLAGAPAMPTVGATLFTVTDLLPAAECLPSSSFRSTMIRYGSNGVAVGSSSA